MVRSVHQGATNRSQSAITHRPRGAELQLLHRPQSRAKARNAPIRRVASLRLTKQRMQLLSNPHLATICLCPSEFTMEAKFDRYPTYLHLPSDTRDDRNSRAKHDADTVAEMGRFSRPVTPRGFLKQPLSPPNAKPRQAMRPGGAMNVVLAKRTSGPSFAIRSTPAPACRGRRGGRWTVRGWPRYRAGRTRLGRCPRRASRNRC